MPPRGLHEHALYTVTKQYYALNCKSVDVHGAFVVEHKITDNKATDDTRIWQIFFT